MDMIAGVVTGRVSVPSMIEFTGFVFLVVVQRKIAVFEPHYLQPSGSNACWVNNPDHKGRGFFVVPSDYR